MADVGIGHYADESVHLENGGESMNEKVQEQYLAILKEELVLATGCTEPIAIAYGAAHLRQVLGALPERPYFPTLELNDAANIPAYREQYGLQDRRILCSSDAHHLWDIREQNLSIELDDEPYSSARVRQALIDLLRRSVNRE